MKLRTLGITALIAAALAAGVFALWTGARPGSVYTDAASIREPAPTAPVRRILWQPAARLPGPLNTDADEYEPHLSPDGRTLLLVRGRPGDDGIGAGADIFRSELTTEGWSEPRAFTEINSDADELGPAMSADGRAIYFYSDRSGGLGGYDLWVSRLDNGTWSAPANLGPGVNSPHNDYAPAPTPDGATLYFASNRPRSGEPPAPDGTWSATLREQRSRRDYDLYVCEIGPAHAGAAEPVASLNTPADEGCPAVSPFGDFLYFASDRAGGAGGLDLYRSRRLRGGHTPAENVGTALNSPWDDLDPTLTTGGYAVCFSSSRPDERGEGAGRFDLFWSTSREVFLEREPLAAGIDWSQVLPILWWLLLLLLLLLLLMRIPAAVRSQRFGRLSLLAKCLLASLLVHALLLLALTLWQVGVGIENFLKRPGGSQIAVELVARGEDLAAQLRSGLSDLPPVAAVTTLQIERPEPAPAEFETSAPAVPAAEVAVRPAVPSAAEATPHVPAPTAPADPPASSAPLATSAPNAEPAQPVTEASSAPPVAAMETISPNAPSPAQASAADPVSPPAHLASRNPTAPAAVMPPADSSPTAVDPTPTSPTPVPRPTPRSITVETPTQNAPTPTAEPAPAQIAASAARVIAPPPATALVHRTSDLRPAPPVSPSPTGHITALLRPALIEEAVTQDSLAAPQAPRKPPTSVAMSSLVASGLPDTAARAATGPEEPSLPKPAPLAMASFTAAPGPSPAQAALPSPAPLERAPADPASNIARGPLVAAESSPAAPARSLPGSSSTPAPSAPSLAVRTPAAEPGGTPSPSEATPASPVATAPASALDQVRPGPPAAASARLAPALIPGAGHPARPQPPLDEAVVRAADAPDHPSARSAIPSTPVPATPAVAVAIPRDTAPAAETYTQRAPEARPALVQQLGGSDDTERAVALALAWLARHQSPDGRWSSSGFDDACGSCGGSSNIRSDVALTGLSLLCFLGADHTHTKEGPYREHVTRALRWMVAQQTNDGDLRAGETMYSHGIAAIALSEAYGMTGDAALRRPVQLATDFIVAAANPRTGGWRYEPRQDGDTSVLGWQVLALVSARRAGIEVPQRTLDDAGKWLTGVTWPRRPGVYSYQPGLPFTPSMTAEGLFVRQLIGHGPDDPAAAGSVALITQNLPQWGRSPNTYYWYYATLALFQHQGEAWVTWNRALTAALLQNQRTTGPAAGSWDPRDKFSMVGGRVYQTALCTLCLEVYYRYLPMYSSVPRTPPAPAAQPGAAAR